MKYLKLFSSASAANTWSSGNDYVTPNIVLITGTGYGHGLYYSFTFIPT